MLQNSEAFSGFSVNDIAKANEFYGQKLGLQITEQGEMGFSLDIAGGNSIFVYPKEDHIPATFTILNFPVDDIDEAVKQLADRGISLERYENMYQDEKGITRGRAAKQGPDIAWFKDPAGNILSILQD